MTRKPLIRSALIWGVVLAATLVPLAAAATSPLLAWRQPVYIAAGFAGIAAMALLLFQPLLAGGSLPGLPPNRSRRLHRLSGFLLSGLVLAHVAGLWITSPPDVVDALLFRSPTPFSAWGVLAMWAVLAAAVLALLRRRLPVKPHIWRAAHVGLAGLVVIGSSVHALQIIGTMETVSKTVLCILILAATIQVVFKLKIWPLKTGNRKAGGT